MQENGQQIESKKKVVAYCRVSTDQEIYVKEDDGYEDENGDFHFVKRDYLFKTVYGTWYIKKKLRILLLIALHFNDYNRFYNFIVNRQIQLLFYNEQ